MEQENPQLELKVNIYNINSEVNAEIVRKSQSLKEYSQFIGRVKENLANNMPLDEAIKEAIEYGIAHDIMKEFLEKNGSEVENMLYTEWDWDKALAIHAEEAYEDGVAYGEKRGKEYGKQEERKKLIRALDGVLPAETIAEKFHLSKEYVLSVLQDSICVCEPKAPYINSKKQEM